MEAQGGSFNSTRLSLDLVNLPLTPFGMNRPGSNRKRHPVYSPRDNKLSLKNLKSPQQERYIASLQKDNKENKRTSDSRRVYRRLLPSPTQSPLSGPGRGHEEHSQNTLTSLSTVFENEDDSDNDAEDDGDAGSCRRSEVIENCVRVDGTDAIPNQRQTTQNSASDTSRRRDSVFTDIDDGSFIEFYDGKENNPPASNVIGQGRSTPQLYYTCESQNDTLFSTSTKTKAAPVGFRKFVEKMREEKVLNHITEESNEDVVVHFPLDESIITGSADVMRRLRNKTPKERAVNSTMIGRPSDVQARQPLCLPDISTLTIQTHAASSTDSGQSTPDASPNVSRNHRTIFKTVIIDSSDSENSVGNQVCRNEGVGIEISNKKRNVSRNNHNSGAAHVNNSEVASNTAVHPERGKADKMPVSIKRVFATPNEFNSLISEDVSVINSCDHNEHQLPLGIIYETQSQDSTFSNGETSSKSNGKREARDHEECDNDYDADSEGKIIIGSLEKRAALTPDNVKSPDVAKWVLTSPFKEGSYGSSFLRRHDSLDTSETPSQPKFMNPTERASKTCGQQSPSLDEVPLLSRVRKIVQAQDNDPVTEPARGNVLKILQPPEKHIYMNPNNAKSPDVEEWVMTSPFKDGSYDSSFLQHQDTSDISETPSQPKSKANHDSSGSCERSHYLRLAERIKASCNRSLLQQVEGDGNDNIEAQNSSDSEDSEEIVRRRKSRNAKAPIRRRVVLESDNSSNSDIDKMSSPLRNVNLPSSPLRNVNKPGSPLRNVNLPSSPLRNVSYERRKGCVDKSHVSETSGESESLCLRLSGALSKSQKTSNKSLYTVGKDAASPNSLNKSANTYSSESEDSFIIRSIHTGNKLRISDSESNISLPDVEAPKPFGIVNSPKVIIHSRGKKGKGRSIGNKAQEECNSERRQNETAKSIGNRGTNGKCSKSTNENCEYLTSDEDSPIEIHVSSKPSEKKYFVSQATECPETSDQTSESKDKSYSSRRAKKTTTKDSSYQPQSESEDANDSSFEAYLRSIKKQIQTQKNNPSPRNKKNKDICNFINDDDSSDDGVSFYLPSLANLPKKTTKPNHNLDWRSCGSVSDDLRTKKRSPKQSNVFKKKLSEPKFVTTSPLTSIKKKTIKKQVTNTKSWRKSAIVEISSDSDSDDVFPQKEPTRKPDLPLPFITPRNKVPPKVKSKTEVVYRQVSRKLECDTAGNATPSLTFLASLSSSVLQMRCHPDALLYVKNFKKRKEDLCNKLYTYYNNYVFSDKLPTEMNIKWNARMTKTAGFCYYQIDRSKPSGRGSRIELSSKVIDVPERLRDTLIHEMCHAAAWIISGYKDGHGPLWKLWAAKARSVFPELPAITTCHSYEINCKYTYRCTGCSYSIGRHSKSLDTERKVCGYCYGKFELIVNSRSRGTNYNNSGTPASQGNGKTPRTPGAFAMFVKENYGSIKKSKQNLKHADVMKLLSAEFGKMKTNST